VLYNSKATIARYAAALAPSLGSGFARLIAVDNASPDGSAGLLRELLPEADMITNSSNLGFAGGCNSAWPSVTTPYWLLLNPDVKVTPAGLEALVGWMDAHSAIGVASPVLRGTTGEKLSVARAHDSLWRPVVELLRLHKLVPEPLRSTWLLSGRLATPETFRGWVPGAALIARSEAVEQVGPLNDSLFLYGEDREWCWRMSRHGWRIGVCPSVEFLHVGGSSARATWDEEERAKREVAGHLNVTSRLRGARWTRIFALCVGLALGAESLDPRREKAFRDESRRRSRLYLGAVRAGVRE
jgi:GT2 family glycosyltransferase